MGNRMELTSGIFLTNSRTYSRSKDVAEADSEWVIRWEMSFALPRPLPSPRRFLPISIQISRRRFRIYPSKLRDRRHLRSATRWCGLARKCWKRQEAWIGGRISWNGTAHENMLHVSFTNFPRDVKLYCRPAYRLSPRFTAFQTKLITQLPTITLHRASDPLPIKNKPASGRRCLWILQKLKFEVEKERLKKIENGEREF